MEVKGSEMVHEKTDTEQAEPATPGHRQSRPSHPGEDNETTDRSSVVSEPQGCTIVSRAPIGPDDGRPQPSRQLNQKASSMLSQLASRIKTRSWPEPAPPPDGGLKAWTQVAMGFLVIFTTWGYVNSFGSFQTYYTETLPQSPSTISWIGSVQVWLTCFTGAFSGRMLDVGFFLPTAFVGIVLQLTGIFLMSFSTKYWQFMLTQGVLSGIGGGIFFTPSVALIPTYFSKRRALAVGLATTGNSAGGMVYPIVTRQLLAKIGFAWTTRVLGFINLSSLVVVLAFMRPRLPPRTSGPVIDWAAFREPPFLCWGFGLFFMLWDAYFSLYYIASYGIQVLNMSFSDATLLLVLVNGAGLPVRALIPLLADRFGPINCLVPITLVYTVLAFSWSSAHTVTGLYLFTVFYGILFGAFQCLVPTTSASTTKRLDRVGTRIGMIFSLTSFAALSGPPIGGALQSADGGEFTGAIAWAGASSFCCLGMLGALRVIKGGWNWRAKC